jgi:ABC-type uncharacterized transport system involved in gliding motility auxiliary subunit
MQGGGDMNKKIFYLLASLTCFSYFVVIATWITLPTQFILNVCLSIFSLIVSIVWVLSAKSFFKNYFESRFFKSLSSHMVSVFLVLIIMGLLNYLAFKNPLLWDLSKRGFSSLTKQSEQVLEGVEGELTIKVFSKKSNFPLFKQLTELYRLTRPSTNVDFIDAELRADLVKSYQVEKVPAIVVEYAHDSDNIRKKTIHEFSEQRLSSAIVDVVRKKELVLYFTKGHGEIELEDPSNEGAAKFAQKLKGRHYRLKSFLLAQAKTWPTDISALVIWGPKRGFFQQEFDLMDKYLEQGGNIIVALDPNFQADSIEGLRSWLKRQGLLAANNLVIDRLKFVNGSHGTIPFVHLYNEDHPINQDKLDQVFFPLVNGLRVNEEHRNSELWSIIALSNQYPAVWGETDNSELAGLKMKYHEGVDLKGPLGYVAAWENKKKSKILVFGNSSFITNTYAKFSSNALFALNSFSWLVGEKDLISFDVAELKDRPILMGQNQLGVIFYFSVIFLPLLLVIISFLFFQRRKKL